MAYAPDARSLGDLFSDLTREITTLLRNELALARAEMSVTLSRVLAHVGVIAAGGVVAIAGVFTLAAFLVLLLVRAGLPAWGASLLVGVGLGAVGTLVAMRSLTALRQENLAPTETIETLKESTAWKPQTK
jgi:tetrahydromethanopterin S-methyltransferase subunit E